MKLQYRVGISLMAFAIFLLVAAPMVPDKQFGLNFKIVMSFLVFMFGMACTLIGFD